MKNIFFHSHSVLCRMVGSTDELEWMMSKVRAEEAVCSSEARAVETQAGAVIG